jgi:hypothetical protein
MGGADEAITLENLELYLELLTGFILRSGIEGQLNAFRDGFCTVFPLEKLAIFTPDEVGGGWGCGGGGLTLLIFSLSLSLSPSLPDPTAAVWRPAH